MTALVEKTKLKTQIVPESADRDSAAVDGQPKAWFGTAIIATYRDGFRRTRNLLSERVVEQRVRSFALSVTTRF